MRIECAPLQNGDTERLKEIRADPVGLNAGRIRSLGPGHNLKRRSGMPIAKNPDIAGSHRANARNRGKPLLQPLEEGGHLRVAISGAWKVEAEKQDVVRLEPQWN